ncbi:MAG: hypothetical protein ACLS43_10460 [Evtepia gabavorous]
MDDPVFHFYIHLPGANPFGFILNGQGISPPFPVLPVFFHLNKGPLKKQAVSSKETLCNFAASFFQKTGHSKLARFFALPVNHFFLSVLPQKDACPAGLSGGPPLWYAGSPSGAGMGAAARGPQGKPMLTAMF